MRDDDKLKYILDKLHDLDCDVQILSEKIDSIIKIIKRFESLFTKDSNYT